MAIDRDDRIYMVDMTARIPLLIFLTHPPTILNGNLLMTPIIQNLVVSKVRFILV